MALYENAGIGGGSVKSPLLAASFTWRDEEEEQRKRRQQGAAVHVTSPDEFRQADAASVKQYQDQQRVAQVAAKQMNTQRERDSQQIKGIEEYFTVARRFGGEKAFAYRMSMVSTYCDIYLKPYPKAGLVWDLARSEYGIKDIEMMLKEANKALTSARNPVLPESMFKSMGLDSSDPSHVRKVYLETLKDTDTTMTWLRLLRQQRYEEMLKAPWEGTAFDTPFVRQKVEPFMKEHGRTIGQAAAILFLSYATAGLASWLMPSTLALAGGGALAGSGTLGVSAPVSIGFGALTGEAGGTIIGGSIVGGSLPAMTGPQMIVGLLGTGLRTAIPIGIARPFIDDKKTEQRINATNLKGAAITAVNSNVAIALKNYGSGHLDSGYVRELALVHGADATERALGMVEYLRQQGTTLAPEDIRTSQRNMLEMWGQFPEMDTWVRDLEANGKLTDDWIAAMVYADGFQKRLVMSLQQQAKEAHFAPSWLDVNGDANDPAWAKPLADFARAEAAKAQMQDTDPSAAHLNDLVGTTGGFRIFMERTWRSLSDNGMLSVPFEAPLLFFEKIGRGFEGMLFFVDNGLRQYNDPEYMTYVNTQHQMIREIAEAASDEERKNLIIGTSISQAGDVPTDTMPSWLNEVMKGPLGQNPELAEIDNARRNRERELIARRVDPSLLGIMSGLAGIDAEKFDRWYEENKSLAMGVDFALEAATACLPFGSARAHTRQIKRSVFDVATSEIAQRDIQTVVSHIANGRVADAFPLLRGDAEAVADAVKGVQRLLFEDAPSYRNLQARVKIQGISKEVLDHAIDGRWDDVEALVTKHANADTARWFKDELRPLLESSLKVKPAAKPGTVIPDAPINPQQVNVASIRAAVDHSNVAGILDGLGLAHSKGNVKWAERLIDNVQNVKDAPAKKRAVIDDRFTQKVEYVREGVRQWYDDAVARAWSAFTNNTEASLTRQMMTAERKYQRATSAVERRMASVLEQMEGAEGAVLGRLEQQLTKSRERLVKLRDQRQKRIVERYGERPYSEVAERLQQVDDALSFDLQINEKMGPAAERARKAQERIDEIRIKAGDKLGELNTPSRPNVAALAERIVENKMAVLYGKLDDLERRAAAKTSAAERRVAGQKTKALARVTSVSDDDLAAVIVDRIGTYNQRAVSASLRKLDKNYANLYDDIHRTLLGRQYEMGDILGVIGRRDKAVDWLGKQYAHGSNIFIHWQVPELTPGFSIATSIANVIPKIQNEDARHILGRFLSGFVQRPIRDIAWDTYSSFERIRTTALAAIGDPVEADYWARVFMRTRGNPGSLQRWEDRFASRLTDIYRAEDLGLAAPATKRAKALNWVYRAFPDDEQPSAYEALVGRKGAQGSFAVNQVTGAPLGEYTMVGAKDKKTLIADTTDFKYTVHVPSFEWARFNRRAEGFAKAFEVTGSVVREAGAVAQRVGAFSRHVTVAWGAGVLFTKHALTDTARTMYAIGPDALWGYANNKRLVQKIFDEAGTIDPQSVRRARMAMDMAVHTEAHWMDDVKRAVTYEFGRFYDKDGHLVVKHGEGARALRRVAQGDIFREYAKGGTSGVTAWLENSSEGRRFVRRSRAYQIAKDMSPSGASDDVVHMAARDYILNNTVVMYQQIKEMYPLLYDDMAGMARRGNVDADRLFKNLTERNKGKDITELENPILAIGKEAANDKVLGSIEGFFTNITGKAMYMNMLNRKMAWHELFIRAYKSLGDDLDAAEKVRIASTVAAERSMQIHFDLARAIGFEHRYRWAAWFGTKHRLWNTFLLKKAAENPFLAGAVMQYERWMEERNKDMEMPEYERHAIQFDLFGHRISINPAPIMWIGDWPVESSLFYSMKEMGAQGINLLFPDLVHTAPNMFKEEVELGNITELMWSVLDVSRVAQTASSVSGLLQAAGSGLLSNDATMDNLVEFESKMEPYDRKLFEKQVSLVIALRGGNISAVDAAKEVVYSRIGSAAKRFFAPSSFRWFDKADMEVNARMRTADELEGDARYDWMQENPDLATLLLPHGSTMEETMNIQEGQLAYYDFKDRQYEDAVARFEAGLLRDPDQVAKFFSEWDEKLEDMKRANPDWANYFYSYSKNGVDRVCKLRFPSTTPEQIAKLKDNYTRNSSSHLASVRRTLEDDFVNSLSKYGADRTYLYSAIENYDKGGDMTSLMNDARVAPLIKWLYYDNVVKPYESITRDVYKSFGLNAAERRLSRCLARGGEVGMAYALSFEGQIEETKKLKMWTNLGIATSGKAATVKGFAGLPNTKKAELGWVSSPRAEEAWRGYAADLWAIEQYRKENNISKNKTEWKNLQATVDARWEAAAESNPAFKAEWEFCKLPLYERLEALDVVNWSHKSTQAKRGWQDFLDIMSYAHERLDQVWNKSTRQYGVSFQAEAGKDVAIDTVRQILALRRANEDWYDEWSIWLDLNAFGFSQAWRVPGDDDLWQTRMAASPYMREEEF